MVRSVQDTTQDSPATRSLVGDPSLKETQNCQQRANGDLLYIFGREKQIRIDYMMVGVNLPVVKLSKSFKINQNCVSNNSLVVQFLNDNRKSYLKLNSDK